MHAIFINVSNSSELNSSNYKWTVVLHMYVYSHHSVLFGISLIQHAGFTSWRARIKMVTNNCEESNLENIIRNIATNVASKFTRTCRLFSIVVTSSKYVGNFDHWSNLKWSFQQVFPRFTDSKNSSQFVNQRYGLAWHAGIGKSQKN